MTTPTTRYARSGDVHVAYQEFGDGPANLVFVPGFVSHIENYWTHPDFALWLDQLGSFARVVMFDKRGTGLSDRVGDLPAMDERMDDVRAVMDAVGMERAAVFGISEGGSLATGDVDRNEWTLRWLSKQPGQLTVAANSKCGLPSKTR